MQNYALQLANLYKKRSLINRHITKETRIIRITYYIIYTLINHTILYSIRLTALIYAIVGITEPGDIAKATGIEEPRTPYMADLRII
jgi:hypothetical protein